MKHILIIILIPIYIIIQFIEATLEFIKFISEGSLDNMYKFWKKIFKWDDENIKIKKIGGK